jgi:hypothetical protein
MTGAELVLGYETVKHLDAWLAHNVAEGDERFFGSERARLRELMLALAASDDTWLDRGWWRVYDEVSSQEQRNGP